MKLSVAVPMRTWFLLPYLKLYTISEAVASFVHVWYGVCIGSGHDSCRQHLLHATLSNLLWNHRFTHTDGSDVVRTPRLDSVRNSSAHESTYFKTFCICHRFCHFWWHPFSSLIISNYYKWAVVLFQLNLTRIKSILELVMHIKREYK